ncbi:MAG: lysophospholipase L1-like esterase [Verrucomicrobiales bacterium]|jgi:lysophospholipase L1-like esterase
MIAQFPFRSILPVALIAGMVISLPNLPNPVSAEEPTGFTIPATDEGLAGSGPIRRYDWFQDLWTQKRSKWANDVATDQNAVVFLGDSITQGWGDTMGGNFPGMKVANRGISGDTTRGMLLRLNDDVLALNPKAVVMLMGTNDLEEGANPASTAANVMLILKALKKHDASVPVILCHVFPSAASQKRPAKMIQKINEYFANAVKGEPRITLLDTWTLFANAKGDAKKEEFPDLLHPNDTGYDKWATALRPVLATLGLMETEADDFQMEDGFTSLFNGQDLTGWGYAGPKGNQVTEDFDGMVSSSDGRYSAINGRLVVKTPPEGRKLAQLWTKQQFPEDFVLKLEFRATPNADSGVFLRKPQLQCRDYLLAGPYKKLQLYKPQDWNELIVTLKEGIAHCTCNGEILEAAMKLPKSGPIGLEGDRGQMEYRHIRIKL